MSDDTDGTLDWNEKAAREDYQRARRLRAMVRVTRLLPSVELDLRDAIYNCYQSIGHDLGWNDKTPSDDEFADVMIDRVEDWDTMKPRDERYLSDVQWQAFHHLSYAEKRAVCLEVGP